MSQLVRYPILEGYLTSAKDGVVSERLIPSCAFHDLTSESENDLAGMGLAILGNVIRHAGGELYDAALGAKLLLKRWPGDAGIECPFPGMPSDQPLPMDLMQLPFDAAMFLEQDKMKRRVDRLMLMERIKAVWVPWLRSQLIFSGVS